MYDLPLNLNRLRCELNEFSCRLSLCNVQTYGELGNPTYLSKKKFHDKYFALATKLLNRKFLLNRSPYRPCKVKLYDTVNLKVVTLFLRGQLILLTLPLIFQALQFEPFLL